MFKLIWDVIMGIIYFPKEMYLSFIVWYFGLKAATIGLSNEDYDKMNELEIRHR